MIRHTIMIHATQLAHRHMHALYTHNKDAYSVYMQYSINKVAYAQSYELYGTFKHKTSNRCSYSSAKKIMILGGEVKGEGAMAEDRERATEAIVNSLRRLMVN